MKMKKYNSPQRALTMSCNKWNVGGWSHMNGWPPKPYMTCTQNKIRKQRCKQWLHDTHTKKQLKKQKCEQFFFKKQKVVSRSTSTRAFRDYKQDERISSQRTLKFQECMKYTTYN
jgi:hypothetical protein